MNSEHITPPAPHASGVQIPLRARRARGAGRDERRRARGAELVAHRCVHAAAAVSAVIGSSVEREPVAPGVRARRTVSSPSAGPAVVSVVTVDPREPSVRSGDGARARQHPLEGRAVSSMARRTGAVAGINGDYFDINASGAPLGILVRNGNLDRTPSAASRSPSRRPRGAFRNLPLRRQRRSRGRSTCRSLRSTSGRRRTASALLTPSFGDPAERAEHHAARPAAVRGGRRRDQALPGRCRSPLARRGPPDRVCGSRTARPRKATGRSPTLATSSRSRTTPIRRWPSVAAAVGGGPLLLQGGAPVDDPASPNYADRERRIPAAAAARLADGTLALVVVDGRHPATSIGVNRAELIALLRALGRPTRCCSTAAAPRRWSARVARRRRARASLNEPSDGVERPVADGLFVYSDAPLGPPARLVVRPARIVALPGARVALRARLIDANDHASRRRARSLARSARRRWSQRIGETTSCASAGAGQRARCASRRGGVATRLPLEIVDRVARIVIGPPRVNPDPHAALALTADAFDARDRPRRDRRPRALDRARTRRSTRAAGSSPAIATHRSRRSAGGVNATVTIPVGRHAVPLALFDDATRGLEARHGAGERPGLGHRGRSAAAARLRFQHRRARGVRGRRDRVRHAARRSRARSTATPAARRCARPSPTATATARR